MYTISNSAYTLILHQQVANAEYRCYELAELHIAFQKHIKYYTKEF